MAEKLGINRSAVHHRLMGRTNMTTETLADMVWALGCKIAVRITDASDDARTNDFIARKRDPDIEIQKKEVMPVTPADF